ncbi:MAG TPA: hypothetical protein DEP42_02035 [Ruminococcaceae bacterium]|nr:hypothetical protein [Oscillospiraceae bacterium]
MMTCKIMNEPKAKVTGVAQLLQVALQAIMQGELDATLGYHRSKRRAQEEAKNFRNGYSPRMLHTAFGLIPLAVPRDRLGLYSPNILKRYCRDARGLENKLLFLFAQETDSSTFLEQIRALYDKVPAREELEYIGMHLLPAVRAWQMRRLERAYSFIALDAIQGQGADDRIAQILIGEGQEGIQEVLSIHIASRPSFYFWTETLADLRARGLEQAPAFCVGCGTGFHQAVHIIFPNQTPVHAEYLPGMEAEPEAVATKS